MADFAAHEMPMKGFLLHITTSPTHVIDGPASALPALPTYPIAAADATWQRIRAISDPTGMDEFDVETAQYRNGDPETPIVVNYPTGFLQLKPFTCKAAWSRELYTFLKGLEVNRTKVRYLFTWPITRSETTPSRSDCRAYVTGVKETGQAPIMIEMNFEKCDDIPTFTQGS